jgi:hypothetical protein
MVSIFLKCSVLLSVALLLAGCETVPKKQAFDSQQASTIKTITIAVREDETKYPAQLLSHPASAVGGAFGGVIGGAIGGGIAASDLNERTDRLTASLNPSKTRLRQVFVADLERHLAKAGYQTRRTSFAEALDFKAAVEAARAPNAADVTKGTDATLVAYMRWNGYTAPFPNVDYEPEIMLDAKLIARDGRVLFEDRLTYGFRHVASTAIHREAPESHRFKNMDALLANPDKTRAVLVEGARVVAEQLSRELKR